LLGLLPYFVLGPTISFLAEGLHTAWMRIADRQRNLEEEIEERKRAERALQLADRRKDEFLATLAHELRNPLAPLSTGLQVLQLADSDPETRRRVQSIMERQVESMVRLIDDLLDVSRINRGKIDLQTENLDLATVIVRAVETAQPILGKKQQTLSVSLPDEEIVVQVDPVRIAQVLSNLLNNASKFSDGGSEIRLTARKEPRNVVICVQDFGQGLSPEALDQVFEMFWQNQQNSGGTSGLGIGLTLAQRLVEMHGGRITAASEGIGRGCSFEVTLPIVTGANVTLSKPASELCAEWKPSRRRVLVVDDNADAAESLAKLLRLKSYDVQVANNGLRALETAESFRPDVVLLDIGMPEMDGYEVVRRLRKLPQSEGTLLVALSGYGRESDVRKSLDAGFHEHITKPATIETLKAVLDSRPEL
jgi:signal transduction histidine kinase/CheY-like chemotaxis protein